MTMKEKDKATNKKCVYVLQQQQTPSERERKKDDKIKTIEGGEK